jgi:hypothetical protein
MTSSRLPSRMRVIPALLLIVSAPRLSGQTPQIDTSYHPQSVGSYVSSMIGPLPVIRTLALSGFDQWRGRPRAFPRNDRGFEDRIGSRFGQLGISRTLRFGVARAFDQRPVRYRLCTCTETGDRVMYAILSPLRVSTPTGLRTTALNPATEVASGILVTAVHPGGLNVREGIVAGVTGVASESALSLVREFWPWHWRPPFM